MRDQDIHIYIFNTVLPLRVPASLPSAPHARGNVPSTRAPESSNKAYRRAKGLKMAKQTPKNHEKGQEIGEKKNRFGRGCQRSTPPDIPGDFVCVCYVYTDEPSSCLGVKQNRRGTQTSILVKGAYTTAITRGTYVTTLLCTTELLYLEHRAPGIYVVGVYKV